MPVKHSRIRNHILLDAAFLLATEVSVLASRLFYLRRGGTVRNKDQIKFPDRAIWGQKGPPKRAIFGHKKFSVLFFFLPL